MQVNTQPILIIQNSELLCLLHKPLTPLIKNLLYVWLWKQICFRLSTVASHVLYRTIHHLLRIYKVDIAYSMNQYSDLHAEEAHALGIVQCKISLMSLKTVFNLDKDFPFLARSEKSANCQCQPFHVFHHAPLANSTCHPTPLMSPFQQGR